jgi:hypothetical protein
MGRRDGAEKWGKWSGIGIGILDFGFWGNRQRRGTHVSTPERGSRDGVFCTGGILKFHAVLRREMEWGNLN